MKYLLILALGLIGCGNNSTFYGSPKVIGFGDSLSYDEHGQVYQFAAILNVTVNNQAKPGSKLEQEFQYDRIMRAEVVADNIVLFQPGINDAFTYQYNAAYLTKYETLMKSALDRLESTGALVLVGTTTRTNHFRLPDDLIKTYGDIARKVISEGHYKNVFLVDTYNLFNPVSQYMYDEIHPNPEGYKFIGNIYYQAYLQHRRN